MKELKPLRIYFEKIKPYQNIYFSAEGHIVIISTPRNCYKGFLGNLKQSSMTSCFIGV